MSTYSQLLADCRGQMADDRKSMAAAVLLVVGSQLIMMLL